MPFDGSAARFNENTFSASAERLMDHINRTSDWLRPHQKEKPPRHWVRVRVVLLLYLTYYNTVDDNTVSHGCISVRLKFAVIFTSANSPAQFCDEP